MIQDGKKLDEKYYFSKIDIHVCLNLEKDMATMPLL